MSLRVQAIEGMAELLRGALNLASTVEILAAPPSKAASYPACAILVDRTSYDINDDLVPVDADGAPLVGPDATMDLPTDWGRFDADTLIYQVGTYTVSGRIFVATRHPAQRAELEEQVFALFFADDLAPGRILLTVDHPKVGGRQLPWSWPVALFLADDASTWTSEYAFDERLWSWLKFEMDVDIFVPQTAPPITTLVLEMDADFTQPVLEDGTVTDLDDGDDNETVQVNQAGDISPYP